MNKYTEAAIAYLAYGCGKIYNISRRHREADIQRILVVRTDAIGDMVVTLPFLRELRKNYPYHRITLVCSPLVYNLVERCPYIDEVLIYRKQYSKHKYMTNFKTSICFADKYFRKRNYELAVVPSYASPDAYADAWLCFWAGAKRRIGYAEQVDDRKYDYYMGSINCYFTDLLDACMVAHEVEAPLELLRQLLHGSVTDESVELWTDEEDKKIVAGMFHSMRLGEGKIKIAVNLSTSNRTKDWPVDNYAEVCQYLQMKYPVELLLIGAGHDAEEYRDRFCSANVSAHDFIGKTTLRQTVEVLRQSDMYLGGDTGPMHLAAACGLTGVVIYKTAREVRGRLRDPAKMFAPWQSDMTVIQPERALPGCEDGCERGEAHCIKQITVKQVVAAMEEKMAVRKFFHKEVQLE